MVAAQLLPLEYSLILGIAFIVLGLAKPLRIFLLFGFTIIGHLCWFFIQQYLAVIITNDYWLNIIERLGLLGYIVLFAIWERFQPSNNSYLRLGNLKERIKFPLIWYGFNDFIWRFILIFCSLCLAVVAFFSLRSGSISIMLFGLLFALTNSILEEVLWRSFILGRVVDCLGEKQALIVTSIAFGFYHLSLGFSVWVCLAFAIGGFYFGGCAVRSKGIGAPIIMHIFVNMVFVSSGIIFSS
jgi:membrane protease YdiL (CAAX protease family)